MDVIYFKTACIFVSIFQNIDTNEAIPNYTVTKLHKSAKTDDKTK